jgi:hypothetical protein
VIAKLLAICTAALLAQAPQPSDADVTQLLTFIRPKSEELVFEKCDWKPTFWEAVVDGQKLNKPILLWAMNGHPMACT